MLIGMKVVLKLVVVKKVYVVWMKVNLGLEVREREVILYLWLV